MKNWQIDEILFYSHHEELRKLKFKHNAATIIVGPSGTGKSAVLTAVDYTLSSSRVRIPHFVEVRCSAIGTLWARDNERMLICRGTGTNRTKYWVRHGDSRTMASPTSVETLGQHISSAGARESIRRSFGIGEMIQALDDEDSATMRLSIRHLMPYLLMSKESLSNEQYLLHGQADPKSGRQVDDTIEYFLGVLDERSLAIEDRLRRHRRDMRRLKQDQKSRNSARTTSHEQAIGLLTQARSLGLVEEVDLQTTDPKAVRDALVRIHQTKTSPLETSEDGSARAQLAEQQDALGQELAARRRELRRTKATLATADEFKVTLGQQARLLQPVRLFDNIALDTSCAVCGQEVEQPSQVVDSLNRALRGLAYDSSVTTEQRNAELARQRWLEERIAELEAELSVVDSQLSSLARVDDEVDDRGRIHQMGWMRGRVSYFLDEVAAPQGDDLSDRIAHLEELIEEAEAEVRSDERAARRTVTERRLSSLVEKYVKERLPHREPCDKADYLAFLRPITMKLSTVEGDIIDLPQVGSDENYLSIHLAFLVALHQIFKERARPVPSVILIDQISRPFYPNETGEVEVKGDDADAEAIRRYFRFVFDVAESLGLQFIIIEHAYIGDDPRYVRAAERYRWSYDGEKLIPENWPTRPAS